MTHLQALIYIIVFLALIFLTFSSITILTAYIKMIAAAIAKNGYSENISKEMIMFVISLSIILAYLLF